MSRRQDIKQLQQSAQKRGIWIEPQRKPNLLQTHSLTEKQRGKLYAKLLPKALAMAREAQLHPIKWTLADVHPADFEVLEMANNVGPDYTEQGLPNWASPSGQQFYQRAMDAGIRAGYSVGQMEQSIRRFYEIEAVADEYRALAIAEKYGIQLGDR